MNTHPTIGILGGMGPAATGQFILELTHATPAATDQDHFRSIVLSEPSIPDRTVSLLRDDDRPLEPLRIGLLQLIEWGADILAVPCNTAHAYIDRFRDDLSVPLVHIVTATLDAAQKLSPEGAWLTATSGTVASRLYQDAAQQRHYPLALPSETEQENIMQVVALVKANQLEAAGSAYRLVLDRLSQLNNIPALLACTELPLAFQTSGLPADRGVSSLTALAEATVARLTAKS